MPALRLTLRRLVAYGIDVAVLAAVLLPLAFVIAVALGTDEVTGFGVWVRQLAIISAPTWGYFVLGDRLGRGRSLGKRMLGIATTDLAGHAPSWRAALVRTALKLLPWELVHVAFFALSTGFARTTTIQIAVAAAAYALMLVYLAVALRNGGARSVPDLAASTRVRPVTAPVTGAG